MHVVTLHLQHVVDYLLYGKVLREWKAGSSERFLTTGNERDYETGYNGFEGYDYRFGLVYVNHHTQERFIKESGRWFCTFLKN
ncbi:MAG: family 1 glycosylhydrolase [Bacteroidota bacterium]|nr:family 1 glycosylhydrolase [Bacteroidota bacterium]